MVTIFHWHNLERKFNVDYKVALITGASTGIGKAIAESLAQRGVKLILVARRKEQLERLQQELSNITESYVIACDITDKIKLAAALEQLPASFSAVDILVNNAGLALGLKGAQEADWNDWETMINVNCIALAHITRLLLPGMVARHCGHVVNIGSIAGTYPYQGGNVYGATKAFVEQFTLNLKADLLGTPVRATSIEPGMVGQSEFSLVRFKGDKKQAEKVYEGIDALQPIDIANSVVWVLEQPKHVNINRMEIMPVGQAPSRPAYDKKQ